MTKTEDSFHARFGSGFERPNTVAALVDKRGEIAGQIERAQIALRRLIADLDHVDACIRIFAPELATETIKTRPVPPQHQALRGEVKRTALDRLRRATGPITTGEIAEAVMAARRLDTTDQELLSLFIRRIGACMRQMRLKGVVEQVELDGRFKGWRLR